MQARTLYGPLLTAQPCHFLRDLANASGETQVLLRLVVLSIGFGRLVTACHEMRSLIQCCFKEVEHMLVGLHQPTVRLAALVVGQQPCMVANIREQ